MPIRCRCNQCGAVYKVDEEKVGKKIKCAKCANIFAIVPLEGSLSATTAVPVARPTAVQPPPPPTVAVQEPAPLAFPNISIAAAAAAGRKSAAGSSYLVKKSNQALPLILGGGALVAAALGVGAWALFFNPRTTAAKKPAAAAANTKQPAAETSQNGTLVLEWPEAERSGSKLTLDGKPRAIPATGPISFALSPGSYELALQRRGYEPVTLAIDVVAGEEASQRLEWKELVSLANTPHALKTEIAKSTTGTESPTRFAIPKEREKLKPFSVNRPLDVPRLTPDVQVNAGDLTLAFFNNPKAAAEKYARPHVVQVTGTVAGYADIPKNGACWVRIQGSGSMTIDCYFERHWTEFAKTLRVGDDIAFLGRQVFVQPKSRWQLQIDFCEFVGGEDRRSQETPEGLVGLEGNPLPEIKDAPKPYSIDRDEGELAPNITTTAVDISREFAEDGKRAAAMYDKQNVQVLGVVVNYLHSDVSRMGFLRLRGDGRNFMDCRLLGCWHDYTKTLRPGHRVVLIGQELQADPADPQRLVLMHCDYVGADHRDSEPFRKPEFTLYKDTPIKFEVTAETLAKEFIADPQSLYQKYESNNLVRITGVIHAIKEENRIFDKFVLYLRGDEEVMIEMEMSRDWKSFLKTKKPGDKVVMLGLSPRIIPDRPKAILVSAAEFPRDE